MSAVIEMPFGIQDLSKVFDLVDLLDNKEALVEEFKPEVQRFIVKDGFFKGAIHYQYKKDFNELIVRLIKKQVTKHFSDWNPEEILLVCDENFLRMITDNYYFNQEVYKESK